MDNIIDPAILGLYYRQYYPFDLMHKWLSYGNDFSFSKREFSITSNDEIYQRYLSYDSVNDFKNDIISKSPAKIDIGAIFSSKPRIHKIISSNSFLPLEREFVIDIDLTDYDDVRFCCSQTKICHKCWSLVSLAALIIDHALEEDFGFKHRIWVFSGRRGIHCWVCDERARKLNNTSRAAIVEYFSVIKGGEHRDKKVSLSYPLHHSLKRACDKITAYFEKSYIYNQPDIFEQENIKNLFNRFPNKDIQKMLEESLPQILAQSDPLAKWMIIKSIIYQFQQKNLRNIDELMFQFCYPRLDINVSKSMNHLLKSPFCVHPKTGSVCVPIDIRKIEEFDLNSVPNVHRLLGGGDETGLDCETSMNESIEFFQNFISKIK